jgi:hypothetical protein
MEQTKIPDPRLRKFFIAAFSLALLLQAWAGYLRATVNPAPRWTHGLPMIVLDFVFGFWVLLYPITGFTGNIRRLFLATFFGVGTLQLILFFV